MRLGDRNRDRSRSPMRSRKSGCKKVFVSNIPYEFKWKELKELFKKEGIYVLYNEIIQIMLLYFIVEYN